MKKFISIGAITAVIAPLSVSAVTFFDIISTTANILNRIIPVLITLAVVYFIWGVIQYTLSTDEEKKKKARGMIIQGLIGLFVILAFWGIIAVFQSTFGVTGARVNQSDIPCVPIPSAGILCP